MILWTPSNLTACPKSHFRMLSFVLITAVSSQFILTSLFWQGQLARSIVPDIDAQDVVHDIPQITQNRSTCPFAFFFFFKLPTHASSVMSWKYILGKLKHQRWWAHPKPELQTNKTDGNYVCAGVVGVVERRKRYRRCKPLCHVSGCVYEWNISGGFSSSKCHSVFFRHIWQTDISPSVSAPFLSSIHSSETWLGASGRNNIIYI